MPGATTTTRSASQLDVPGRPGRRPSRLARVIGALLLAVALVAGSAAAWVVTQARSYDATPSDAIVVLGASQYWGKPSPVLANRLDHAAELYREGVAPRVITVGGGQPGDRTTEAAAGAGYLIRRGVPAEAIIAVPRGSNTINSLEAVARRMDQDHWTSLTIVSDRAHLARSGAIAEALGLDVHVSGPASGDGSVLTAGYVAREAAGLVLFYSWDRWQVDRAS